MRFQPSPEPDDEVLQSSNDFEILKTPVTTTEIDQIIDIVKKFARSHSRYLALAALANRAFTDASITLSYRFIAHELGMGENSDEIKSAKKLVAHFNLFLRKRSPGIGLYIDPNYRGNRAVDEDDPKPIAEEDKPIRFYHVRPKQASKEE